jgi:tRNA(His) guanylyltransferase
MIVVNVNQMHNVIDNNYHEWRRTLGNTKMSSTTTAIITTTTTPQESQSNQALIQQKQNEKGYFELIAAKMKQKEAEACPIVNPNRAFIVRLDGHNFSTFTAPFDKPFDNIFKSVMLKTAKDVLEFWPDAIVAYTQSDEITLVFPAIFKNEEEEENKQRDVIFGGKLQKIISIASAHASARFNYHCLQAAPEAKNEKVKQRLTGGAAHFDARLFQVEHDDEIVENIRWRSNYDCRRNSILNLGNAHYSTKQMHGKKCNQVIAMLQEEKGIDWNKCSTGQKYGYLLKRSLVKTTIQYKNVTKDCDKRQVSCIAVHLKQHNDSTKELLLSKYWNKNLLVDLEHEIVF